MAASAAGLRQRPVDGYTHPEIEPIDASDEEHQLPRRPAERAGHSRPPSGSRGGTTAVLAALLAVVMVVGTVLLLRRLPPSGSSGASKVLRPEQLARFDGKGGRRLYLAIMGEVYDVTKGMRHYGPKGGYGIFAAKDASRSFVTGKFQEDLTDDVADFSADQMAEVAHWRDFYAKHKEYTRVGVVVGRFYDPLGQPTELQRRVEAAAAAAVARAAEEEGELTEEDIVHCNVKWSKVAGGYVWCNDGLYPRRVLQADWDDGQPQERCACVAEMEPTPAARLYDGCPPDAARCQTSPPEI